MTPTKYEVPPKLPVPSMEDCFDAYLDDLSAILPQEQWEKTRALVEEFTAKDGLGPVLQKKLEELAERVDNWVSLLSNHCPMFYFSRLEFCFVSHIHSMSMRKL